MFDEKKFFLSTDSLGPPLDQPLTDPLSETKKSTRFAVKQGVAEKELASERARNGDSPPISDGAAD
jgi:hypothetical protein